MKEICGIYCITNIVNFKKYVGQSTSIQLRWRTHKSALRYGRYGSSHFQKAWNKYGEENFEFSILEECENDVETLTKKEDYWINFYDTRNPDKGYNSREAGIHGKRSEESNEKIRIARTGTKASEESKERNRISNTGRKHSEETKKKISEANKGKPKSEETKEKLRIGRLGKKMSDETKKKISDKGRSADNPQRGRKHSQERIEKNRQSHIGQKPSEETKKKISESQSYGKSSSLGIKRENSSSVYFGIYLKRRNKRKETCTWCAMVSVNGKRIYLGYFDNEINAAKAYDEYVIKNNLPNPLNFK